MVVGSALPHGPVRLEVIVQGGAKATMLTPMADPTGSWSVKDVPETIPTGVANCGVHPSWPAGTAQA